jgi:hypothetical protein
MSSRCRRLSASATRLFAHRHRQALRTSAAPHETALRQIKLGLEEKRPSVICGAVRFFVDRHARLEPASRCSIAVRDSGRSGSQIQIRNRPCDECCASGQNSECQEHPSVCHDQCGRYLKSLEVSRTNRSGHDGFIERSQKHRRRDVKKTQSEIALSFLQSVKAEHSGILPRPAQAWSPPNTSELVAFGST